MPRKTRKPADEPPSIEQLIAGFSHVERLIFRDNESFRIVRRSTDTAELGPMGKRFLCEEVMAHKGDTWWIEERLVDAPQDSPDPLDARYFISRGDTILNCMGHGEGCAVVPFDDGWNMFTGWQYFIFMGYDANRYVAESGGVDYKKLRERRIHEESFDDPCFPEFLEQNRANYHVAAAPEVVDGFRCWVVEWPEMDKFWVDVEHGFAVRRRIYHWGPGWPLKFAIVQGDFREVKPGLWMPFAQTVDEYAHISTTLQEWRSKVINRTVYKVTELQIGGVPDTRFEVRLPARTRVFDAIRDLRYCVVGDGHDPFYGPRH
jgi:hypothetical protein